MRHEGLDEALGKARAELASMTEMRDRAIAQGNCAANDLRRKYDEIFAELDAYRNGGVTEEILRRNDGTIKIGKDCRIVAVAHEEREGIEGRCIEAGDDDSGQPRLVIHTTRDKLMTFGRNLAFEDVRVTLAAPAK